MNTNSWIQLAIYLIVLVALVKPLGWYMARVYQGQSCGLDRVLGWLERGIYRLAGVDPMYRIRGFASRYRRVQVDTSTMSPASRWSWRP